MPPPAASTDILPDPFPRFLSSGDTALIVEFGRSVDRTLNERVLELDAAVRAAQPPGVVETIPTFRSLMVVYDPLVTRAAEVRSALAALLNTSRAAVVAGRRWRVPVCYEGDLAPDLEAVAKTTGLSLGEVVALHTTPVHHVYMIGFVAGLPYLGDLPTALALPRRASPRVRLPAGSVAIAMGLTVIYPVESPGGWHLIGNTPVTLFDPGRMPPALMAPGDQVVFEMVQRDVFDDMRAAVVDGCFPIAPEPLAPDQPGTTA